MADLQNLVDMGFDHDKAGLAIKHGGNLQGALDWLDRNADKSAEQLEREGQEASEDPPALKDGEVAHSLICNECQKRFRSTAQAEFHAGRSGHTDFSESTDEIAPLTDEEKAAKLSELKDRMHARKAVQSEQDKLEQKRNEEIRRKNTKEVSDAKEDLARKEQLKEAAAKKREKQAEIEAKKRVQAKIASDREARKAKAEIDKAQREGQTFPAAAVESTVPAALPVPKGANVYNEARLRLQTSSGTLQQHFAASTTLFEVAHVIRVETGVEVQTFQSTFPRKLWDHNDFGLTLKEAGLVPSEALIVK